MRPLYFLFGLTMGLCAGIALFLAGADLIIEILKNKIISIIILLVGLAIGGFTAFFLLRAWVIRRFDVIQTPTATNIFDSFFDLIKDPASYDRTEWLERFGKAARGALVWYTSVAGYYALISSVVALVAIFAGMSASLLIFKQNELIKEQKKLFESQTQSTLVQVLLEDSNRRTAVAPTVAKIISQIFEESAKNFNKETGLSTLSEQLSRRTTSILASLAPYIIADTKIDLRNSFTSVNSILDLSKPITESINLVYLSPERGQILKSLMLSKADLTTELFKGADFTYADMRKFKFNHQEVSKGTYSCDDLNNENIKIYKLDDIQLGNADFSGASLTKISLYASKPLVFRGAALVNSSLNFSYGSDKSILTDMSLYESTLHIGSAVSLKGVKFTSDADGCITIEGPVEVFTHTPDISGISIRLKEELSPPVDVEIPTGIEEKIKEYIFTKYIFDDFGFDKSKYEVVYQDSSIESYDTRPWFLVKKKEQGIAPDLLSTSNTYLQYIYQTITDFIKANVK